MWFFDTPETSGGASIVKWMIFQSIQPLWKRRAIIESILILIIGALKIWEFKLYSVKNISSVFEKSCNKKCCLPYLLRIRNGKISHIKKCLDILIHYSLICPPFDETLEAQNLVRSEPKESGDVWVLSRQTFLTDTAAHYYSQANQKLARSVSSLVCE